MSEHPGFIWVDIETPGLDEHAEGAQVLEVGMIHTDVDLNVLSTIWGVTSIEEISIESWDTWCQNTHKESGLIDDCLKSANTTEELEVFMIRWLEGQGFSKGDKTKPLMCGNSIGSLDRPWLKQHMPDLYGRFHYRSIDVSSLYELAKAWYPGVDMTPGTVSGNHRTIADLESSIARLKAYRKNMFRDH